jgi:hypothetical protein
VLRSSSVRRRIGSTARSLSRPGFHVCANQRLQPEDADRGFTERSHGAVSDQVLIAVSKTNTSKYVERSTACEQQMVSFAFQGSRFGAENASGQIAITCVEIRERVEQAGDVGRRAVMNDVEIKVEIGAPASTAATPSTTTKST